MNVSKKCSNPNTTRSNTPKKCILCGEEIPPTVTVHDCPETGEEHSVLGNTADFALDAVIAFEVGDLLGDIGDLFG